MRTKTTTNPAFFAGQLALEWADPERRERALQDPRSVDLLTWNVFASLEHHRDEDWLAQRLQVLGGEELRAPVRIALWTGRDKDPRLTPNPAYLASVKDRITRTGTGGQALDEALRELATPLEVPVRIESPDVLCLVSTFLTAYPLGTGGRDRLLELVDAGLEQARRLGKRLAVAAVYPSGTQVGAQVSAQVQRLRGTLGDQLPHRQGVPEVVLRELSWQQLLRIWESELDWMDLGDQPVKAFLAHVGKLGLR